MQARRHVVVWVGPAISTTLQLASPPFSLLQWSVNQLALDAKLLLRQS